MCSPDITVSKQWRPQRLVYTLKLFPSCPGGKRFSLSSCGVGEFVRGGWGWLAGADGPRCGRHRDEITDRCVPPSRPPASPPPAPDACALPECLKAAVPFAGRKRRTALPSSICTRGHMSDGATNMLTWTIKAYETNRR